MTEKILQLIHEKKWKDVHEEVITLNPVDIAELFDELGESEILILFRLLPKDVAAEVFSFLSSDDQMTIVNAITEKETQYIMNELYFDDMIDFLEELPSNMVKKILKNTKYEERKLINQFLNYPEYSAGSLTTIEYVEFRKYITVREAMALIKETGINKETIYTCYVTDRNRKLEGIVSLRTLVISESEATIEDIMETDIVYVHTHDDQEEVAHIFKKYDFMALPVVDNEDRLIGIITFDDILDVIDQESTEDFQRMAAIQPSETEYLKTSIFILSKHRITWLLILMISATFTENIIHHFETVLESVVVLAAFIPMLMDTGGNAGTQSSTLIIRGMALGEIETRDYFKVMLKELQISSLVGFVLALINFLRTYFIQKIPFNLSVTVSITLFATVVMAKIIGGILPLGARKLKLDPAIMAGPLITTVVDTASLILYFTLASIILKI
ncbi:MAG TPA: magnesium transporter [Eubacteriaceae bacterium]|nr:magnesium transporter [Eubacteriaceae bacterium]